MSSRSDLERAAPKAIAVALAVATVLLVVATLVATVTVAWPPSQYAPSLWFASIFAGLGLSFGGVGAVLVTRLPRNPLGWLLAATGFSAAYSIAAATYTTYNLQIAGGTLPLGSLVSWSSQWLIQLAVLATIVFVPLLFPSGRLPSRRWRIFAAIAVVAIGSQVLEAAFGPWPAGQFPGTPNPFEVHGPLIAVVNVAAAVAAATGAIALLAVVSSLVYRFRRSRGIEREQFKWFAYAGVVALALQIASSVTTGEISNAAFMAALVALDLIPVAIGVAVLRYRLYDVDVVINRTLVYGSLVAVLAAVYGGSVLALETVLAPIARGGSLSVAVSTLLVAALFDPVRRRVRAAVDRRFYRSRYDAAREIAGFGARLRDDVAPETLATMIASTLERTVQPATATIWLRTQDLPRPDHAVQRPEPASEP